MSITKPSLNITGIPGVTPSIGTFTRASTATYRSANGTIKTSNSNELRHDYNPITKEYLGILIEESRSNIVLQSDTIGSLWTQSNISANTLNAIISPDGTLGGDLLVEDNTVGQHVSMQTASGVVSGATISVSSFFKSKERDKVVLRCSTNSGTDRFEVLADIANGVIMSEATNGTGKIYNSNIEPYANGWYRVSATGVPGTATNPTIWRMMANNITSNYPGDNASGLYIWGAQLEEHQSGTGNNSSETSYIPTTGASTVTRSADLWQISTDKFEFDENEGTTFINFTWPRNKESGGSDGSGLFNFTDVGITGEIRLRVSDTRIIGETVPGSFSPGFANSASYPGTIKSIPPTEDNTKIAMGWKKNEGDLSYNGIATATDTSLDIPPNMTNLFLGNNRNSRTYLNGHLKQFLYWPKKLTKLEIQELTS